jgi:hypothetical protein
LHQVVTRTCRIKLLVSWVRTSAASNLLVGLCDPSAPFLRLLYPITGSSHYSLKLINYR